MKTQLRREILKDVGAPSVDKIEITEAMLQAGGTALDPITIVRLMDGAIGPITVAEKVFRAMLRAEQ